MLLPGVVLMSACAAKAHIGQPDVYVRGAAGPYTVYVSVHPPAVVPGAAEIDVRTSDGGVTAVSAVTDDGAIALQPFAQEQKFVGSVWAPDFTRVWKITVRVAGASGMGEMSLPVMLPVRESSRWNLPLVFAGEAIFLLAAGFAGLEWRKYVIRVRAASLVVSSARFPRGLLIVASILILCGAVAALACVCSVIRALRQHTLAPVVQVRMLDNRVLDVELSRALGGHVLDDITADHGHLMHLFLLREPGMDVLLHLHPVMVSSTRDAAEFNEILPPMAPGNFAIYADIAHADGVAETAVAEASLPMETAHALSGDDSIGVIAHGAGAGCGSTVSLPDGYTMRLDCSAPLQVKAGLLLSATLLDASGNAPTDMRNYMGMAGHAVIVARDGSVFAHIHPMGTVMGASMMDPMAGMAMPVSNVAEFPYGFPHAGDYRVFVQMKHGTVVETGAFDCYAQGE